MRDRAITIVIAGIIAAVGFAACTKQHAVVKHAATTRSTSEAQTAAPEQAAPSEKQSSKDVAKQDAKVAEWKQPAGQRADAKKPAGTPMPTQPKSVAKGQPQGPPPNGNKPAPPRREYTFQLTHTVRNIGEIEKDSKHALTPAQAKQVLAIMKPLRSSPKLTEETAGNAFKSLKRVFTAGQLNAMSRLSPNFPGGGRQGQGGPPPGADGPGGPPPRGQDRMRPGGPGGRPPGANGQRPDGPQMMDFNPFYSKAPADNDRAADMVKRMNDLFAALEKKAKS